MQGHYGALNCQTRRPIQLNHLPQLACHQRCHKYERALPPLWALQEAAAMGAAAACSRVLGGSCMGQAPCSGNDQKAPKHSTEQAGQGSAGVAGAEEVRGISLAGRQAGSFQILM